MDDRKVQLKVLKKAYKKVQCRALWFWKLLFALSLLCAGVLVAAKFTPAWVLLYLPGVVIEVLTKVVFSKLLWVAIGVTAVLFLIAVIGWSANAKRLKKTETFLNYRTMRSALKMEKILQR